MIDSHAHLNNELFDGDFKEVIDRSKKKLEKILIISCDFHDYDKTKKIIKGNEFFLLHAFGLHPVEVSSFTEKDLDKLYFEFSTNKELIALGEIGLDYHWNPDEKELQKYFFEKQILIAKKFNKPIIIHCRDAYDDCYEIVKKVGYFNGVIHSFASDVGMAKKFVDLGFYIGLSGPITFKNGTSQKEVAKLIDITKLLLETDSPYLTPVPFRGKRNEPTYVEFVAEEIAFQKKISKKEVIEITTQNFYNLFGGKNV